MKIIIDHVPSEKKFEIIIEGQRAHLEYVDDEKKFEIIHIYVPPDLEGKGIAAALMRKTMEYANENGLHIIPTCRYATFYMKRHLGV